MNPLRPASLSIALLALVSAALVGCSPEPEPTPTPTAAFASEEEAFAAAEETYRAYIDAGNGNGDPADFLTGAALESEIETNRSLEARDLTLSGPSSIRSFRGVAVVDEGAIATVEAEACIDVSLTRVMNRDGVDVTPADRPGNWLLQITFTGSADELLIEKSVPNTDRSC